MAAVARLPNGHIDCVRPTSSPERPDIKPFATAPRRSGFRSGVLRATRLVPRDQVLLAGKLLACHMHN